MELRYYQKDAIYYLYQYLRENDGNPCIVIPTGAGKTPVIATICKDAVTKWQSRVLILAHVKELLEQAAEKLEIICPGIDVGLYSAGLNSRDTDNMVVVGGIQSVYKRACDFGKFDLVIVDEAHLIPPKKLGRYRQFLSEATAINPKLRIVGLTATPYRMESGMICDPGNILNEICYEIGVKVLIKQGYLCELISKDSKEEIDFSELHVRSGEFIAEEAEALLNTTQKVRSACDEIIENTKKRNSCLIFATGIKHAEHIASVLCDIQNDVVETIFGDTPKKKRKDILERFKAGEVKYLVNVGVLTTGFDAPNIDSVILLRPTLSPGLYYQMVGRGFRLHESKKDCLILDYGGNIKRHGCVDQVRVEKTVVREKHNDHGDKKKCPSCNVYVNSAYKICPLCDYEFVQEQEIKHDSTADPSAIISGEISIEEFEVNSVSYSLHTKKGQTIESNHPKTLRVDYYTGLTIWHSEWICFEHQGFARGKAESWWRRRSNAPCPDRISDARALIESGAICETKTITVKKESGKKFPQIIGYELGEKPEWDGEAFEKVNAIKEMFDGDYIDPDDIPF